MSTASPPPIKTRILILSDTHNARFRPPTTSSSSQNVPFTFPLPKADVLLHCGDLTMLGKLHEYEQTLSMLESIDAELKLVIAGNHDISLDEAYYRRRGQYMHRLQQPDESIVARAKGLWMGERARQAGVTYLEEGVYSFALGNGARLRVYASPYQPEFCDFAFPYWRHQDRFNAPDAAAAVSSRAHVENIAQNPVPDFPAIDVMMTHGPPMGILDAVGVDQHVGCEHLLRAARRCRPRLYCFGHIHEGWGAERVRWKEGEVVDEEWERHVVGKEAVGVDVEQMKAQRAAYVDVSSEGGRALQWGTETLMVNASIMTVRYRPHQGPWLVDLDLDPA